MTTELHPRKVAGYGWKPDLPDRRDFRFAAPRGLPLPAKVDLVTTGHVAPVKNQLQLGSCTAHMAETAIDFVWHQAHGVFLDPSRLFVYYWTRYLEGTVGEDSGGQIRDAIKVLATYGAPPESDEPYDITRFRDHPSVQAVSDGQKNLAIVYSRVAHSQVAVKTALAAGHPVGIGFTVYESFEGAEVARTGVMPMPSKGEQVLGGHAVSVVGYDDSTKLFKVRNSWGAGWGQNGYFQMPYAYLSKAGLASDYWVVTKSS